MKKSMSKMKSTENQYIMKNNRSFEALFIDIQLQNKYVHKTVSLIVNLFIIGTLIQDQTNVNVDN